MSRLRKVGNGRWTVSLSSNRHPINVVEDILYDEVLIVGHETTVPCGITKKEALHFMFKLISAVEYKENEAVIQFKPLSMQE